MQLNLTPTVIAKITIGILIFALLISIFDACNHAQKAKRKLISDSLNHVIDNKYNKIDSLKNEKSKIPYTRNDSVRGKFWK